MTKDEIAYVNYSQQISYGRMMVAISEKLELGQNYSDLFNRIRVINQLQALFESEYGKDLEDTDISLIQLIVNAINTLINDYRLVGEISVAESLIITLPNTYSLLVISTTGQQLKISPTPELNGQDAFSTGGAYILKIDINNINDYLDNLATVANTGNYNDLINKPIIPTIPVTSVAGKTGAVVLYKSDVGLGSVDNTSDLNKPLSAASQNALNNKVDKVSGKSLSTNDFSNIYKSKLDSIEEGAEVNTVLSVAGKIGNIILNKSDVGLNNVSNTTDLDKPISNSTQLSLDTKVDKETGKGLSQENYTTAEKSKLASIVQNYRGKFTSATQLKNNVFDPPAQSGNYAVVDSGVGSTALEYIYDDTDNDWSPSGGGSAGDFSTIAGNPYDNTALHNALDDKQDVLGYTPVPNTLTINGKPLDGNIHLTYVDLDIDYDFYLKSEIDDKFGGNAIANGYNKYDWDEAVVKAHIHSNKTVLDGITSTKITDWDDAVSKEHTHSNKAFLDTLISGATIAFNITGNASTATKLEYPRLINGVAFDGSANIVIADNTKLPLAGGAITGDLSITGDVIAGSFIGNLTGNATTANVASSVTNGVYTIGNQSINGVKTFNSSPLLADGFSIANFVHSTKVWSGGGPTTSFVLNLVSLFPNFTSIVNGGNNLSVFLRISILQTSTTGQSVSITLNRFAGKSWASSSLGDSSGTSLLSSVSPSGDNITFTTSANCYLMTEVTILTV